MNNYLENQKKKLLETKLFTEQEVNTITSDKNFEYDDFDEDDENNYITLKEAYKKWIAIWNS